METLTTYPQFENSFLPLSLVKVEGKNIFHYLSTWNSTWKTPESKTPTPVKEAFFRVVGNGTFRPPLFL